MLLDLFFQFFKIGLFAVGGGFATMPFLYSLTYRYDWLSFQDISDMIGVATVLPGPVGVSCAAFIGYKAMGWLGLLTAAAGLITPSVIVILIIAKVFIGIKDNIYVQKIFYGLRPVVCGLIAACGWTFLKNGVTNTGSFEYKPIIFFLILLIPMIFIKKIKIHPAVYIIAGACVGIVFKF